MAYGVANHDKIIVHQILVCNAAEYKLTALVYFCNAEDL